MSGPTFGSFLDVTNVLASSQNRIGLPSSSHPLISVSPLACQYASACWTDKLVQDPYAVGSQKNELGLVCYESVYGVVLYERVSRHGQHRGNFLARLGSCQIWGARHFLARSGQVPHPCFASRSTPREACLVHFCLLDRESELSCPPASPPGFPP